MTQVEQLLAEMNQEAATTRKMLALIPEDKYDFKPHPKSMAMGALATHLAELTSWVSMAIYTDDLNFAANDYTPTVITNNHDLMAHFEANLAKGQAALATATDDMLPKPWVMRDGDKIFLNLTKATCIRHAFSQIVHHRAQLGVYLRLLDIPLPASYGPTADTPMM
jgi:uncharacterized damage-inducible protein DinB